VDNRTDIETLAEMLSRWDDEELEDDDLGVDEAPARAITVQRHDGESDERAMARFLVNPEFLASTSLEALTVVNGGDTGLDELIAELHDQTTKLRDGDTRRAEVMLSAQSHTLDAMFHNLVRRAMANIKEGYSDTGKDYLKLALKAQSQCRTTLDSLTAMKKPIIKQTNISHGHQQINNFQDENPPNELLEQQREWLDRGAQKEAITANQDLETVGEIDGAKVA